MMSQEVTPLHGITSLTYTLFEPGYIGGFGVEEPAPKVEFDDLNIDHIRYEMSFYIPEKDSTQEGTVIRPVRTYLEEDPEKSGVIKGSGFELPEFTKDGVYTLELTAVDAAGNDNRSETDGNGL